MKIVNISPEHENKYFCCLEEWSDEMKEAGDHKQRWYQRMKDKGVRVKLAQDDKGVTAGMIQYMPIEHSIFEGENLFVVLCIWVHGYKEGIGNYQKKGMGTALLKAAEEDCKAIGTNGLVAWGMGLPVWMKASWFRRKGYKVVDKSGIMRLVWKPFNDQAVPPAFIKRIKKPEKGKEKVNITMFRNGWCPAMNLVYERVLRASREFEDKISIAQYDTVDREVLDEWGITDGLFIDGREIRMGPPPSYDKIRKKIEKRAKRKRSQQLTS
jgi:N-acetylglutamate synthase-like GNAT family acetyltransferase